MATLRNPTKRAQVFNLPHSHYCVGDTCHCTMVVQKVAVRDPATGEQGIAVLAKSHAQSLMFLAGETKRDLSESVLQCPDVAGAIARRELVVVN
jgi:hypothetical protein